MMPVRGALMETGGSIGRCVDAVLQAKDALALIDCHRFEAVQNRFLVNLSGFNLFFAGLLLLWKGQTIGIDSVPKRHPIHWREEFPRIVNRFQKYHKASVTKTLCSVHFFLLRRGV